MLRKRLARWDGIAKTCLVLCALAVSTAALAATVVLGTGGNDTIDLSAASGSFDIYGLGGYDQLTGSTADDLIDGGAGNDRLSGGPGSDTLVGGANDDHLDGADGDDTFLYVGERAGYDTVIGGGGVDRIVGSDGDDVIGLTVLQSVELVDAGTGFDVIQLASGGRTIDLSATELRGIDRIRGGYGADTITGSAGDDDIAGGPGSDRLEGGPGRDIARFSLSYASYAIGGSAENIRVRALSGNEGADTLTQFEVVVFADSQWSVSELFPGGGNAAPVATDDFATVASGMSVTIPVLANDVDPDGDSINLVALGSPAFGSVTMSTGGNVTYRAPAEFTGTDRFEYTVADTAGLRATAVVAVTVTAGNSDDRLLELLGAAPEGSWLKVNRNRFQDVWTPLNQRAEVDGVPIGEPRKIISAWGSMAWDSNRSQLIIWGGGHGNYAGNDVYRFDARTLQWERASLPSRVIAPFGDRRFLAVDGAMNAPMSSHTYDNQEFLRLLDRFVTFGGASYNTGRIFTLDDGVTPTGPYLWDPSRAGAEMVGGTTGSHVNPGRFPNVIGAGMWQNRDALVRNGTGAQRPGALLEGTSAVSEDDGRDVLYVSEGPTTGGDLFRYRINSLDHPASDSWELVGVGRSSYADQGAGAFDPARRLYLRTARFGGTHGIVMWDVSHPGPTNVAIRFTPRDATSQFVISRLHGMDFDPVRDVFVLWDGGPDVWYLRPPKSGSPLNTANWILDRATTANGVDVPNVITSTSTGILGKWKYIADYDVMMGLGEASEGQVWVYKPIGWQPRPN